jgi:5-(carboxyamino)imidazole ribonucleotide synthase
MTIGIIGDGQLALMLAESFQKRNIPFFCLGTSLTSPMMKDFPQSTTTNRELFQAKCEQFTLENEFSTVEELKDLLLEKADQLFPNLSSYQYFSDKISQRTLYADLGIQSPKWRAFSQIEEAPEILKEFTYPFILKASAGGYDGKGVKVIRDQRSFEEALTQFTFPLLIEEMIAIKQELAQGFVQGRDGKFTLLPLVETVQVDGICQYVYYPPQISEETEKKIQGMMEKLIKKNLVGIFNFEFFLDQKGEVFINEGAPRPHNSQHLTIDASSFSQFDLVGFYMTQKVYPGDFIKTKNSSMVNILGKSTGENYRLTLPLTPEGLEVFPKLYSKESCSPGRKMGHVNLVDAQRRFDLRDVSQKIFREYDI